MSNIIIDFERKQRCGVEEAIFCESKHPQQIETIVKLAQNKEKNLLFTRLNEAKWQHLSLDTQKAIDYCALSHTAILGEPTTLSPNATQIAIVSGGASDAKVCAEILRTLNYHGFSASLHEDVGVSALWRLTNILECLNSVKLIIAVAGMEAALPTVLSGMVDKPIIAVPTSVGYGVSQGGQLALNACLGSCASGIMTMNIDNGFGAACAAIKILNQWAS